MLKPLLAATALSAAMLGAPAFAQDAATVVATVNGETITLGQLIAMRQGLDPQTTQGLPDAALWDLMLDQMVRQTAVAQAAQPLSKRDTAALEIEKRAYLAGSVLEKVAGAEPTEEELKAAYDQAFGTQTEPKIEYNAAHILVKTKEEAEAIATQLKDGGDFGAIAAEKSTDPTTGPNKGELGWFQPEQMVAPFADAVKSLKKDEVSAPIETQFGWHVIKLIDQRETQPPKFEEIKDQLATQVRRDKVQAEIEKRVADAKVEKTEGLAPDLLGKTELLGGMTMAKTDKKDKLSDAEKLKVLKKKMKKLKAASDAALPPIGIRVEAVTKAVVAKTAKKAKAVSPLAPERFPELPVIAGVEFAAGAAGVKYKGRTDVMLVRLAAGTAIAGAFTKSSTRAASILDCQAKLAGKQETGQGAAIIVNSGNANAFTGKNGQEAVDKVTGGVASALSIPRDRVFSSSTGVIGEPLPAERISAVIGQLTDQLNAGGVADAAQAIMTTDTFPKGATASFEAEGGTINIVGIAKGSGMIAPDMATMLVYVFTDAKIAPDMLQKLLNAQLASTFNAITVDSDTSTSDALIVAATGKSAAEPITDLRSAPARRFGRALGQVMLDLAQQVVRDGEGATKFVEVQVTGAANNNEAHRVAMAIANSPLVKTAIAGEDANWGRVVMAVGKSGAQADRDLLTIRFGDMVLAENGWRAPSYDEAAASAYMKRDHLVIGVDLGLGRGKRTVWTCDLTHGYIDINADYRS